MASDEVARLQTALVLFDDGVELMRCNLRRRHPHADDERIEQLLAEWLSRRPGAPHGDGAGRPRAATT